MTISLPEMPASIAKLPRDERGYPVPWFVAWIDGKPEFRCAGADKLQLAIREQRCWVCGEKFIDSIYAFVIGPMCSVNRVSAEPPAHPECALFSVKACPFLSKPKAQRRESNLPEETTAGAGFAIRRNPGVSLIWTTSYYKLERYPEGYLFRLYKDPAELSFWAEGRAATRAEIMESIETGLPILQKVAKEESATAERELAVMVEKAMHFIPA